MIEKKKLILRNADLNDAEKLAEIEKTCYATEPWSENLFKEEIENDKSDVFVAMLDGETVGHIVLKSVLDEGHIHTVCILPKTQGLGGGSMLIKESLSAAKKRGITQVTLEARESNIGAWKLYERLGFKHIAKRKNFYHGPVEDAFFMGYEINRGEEK